MASNAENYSIWWRHHEYSYSFQVWTRSGHAAATAAVAAAMSGPPSPTAETYPAQPEHEPNGQVSADLPPCERAPPEEEPPETTTDTARLCDGSTEDVTQDDVTEVPSYDTVITVQPEPAHDGMTAETQPLTGTVSLTLQRGLATRSSFY